MDRRIWVVIIIVWHMNMSWVLARNGDFASSNGLLSKGQILQSHPTPVAMQEKKGGFGGKAREKGGFGGKARENELLSRLGSRPPRCEHKCRGCTPCNPTQVPTTASVHFGPQYTNYEPEGWKCKCGSVFFNP